MGKRVNMQKDSTITIIGAGMAGTLQAVLLAQRGFRVSLFERNPDPRKGDAPAGRSVNLALGERGRFALDTAGLLEKVDTFSIPMRGRMLHSPEGEQRLQPYGKDDTEVIYSVHRARLNECLLDAADGLEELSIRFNHQLDRIDWDTNQAWFKCSEDSGEIAHGFKVLIGTDGAGSALRRSMQTQADLGVSEELLETGYKELSIPPGENGEPLLDPNALHVWPRGGFMLIGLANMDNSFTMTLFLDNHASDNNRGFDELENWPAQLDFMNEYFADAVPLIPDLEREFKQNPIGLLGTIRCKKWHMDSKALIIGDAAHAIVPFHGQGVNAAFEDCVALMECLQEIEPGGEINWKEVFSELQDRRIANANAIADMALENYEIMRESVRHEGFLLRKELEHELERRHPGHFIARYSLVMFHRIPYAEAYRRGEIQAGILDELLKGASSLDDVDFETAARLINDKLNTV